MEENERTRKIKSVFDTFQQTSLEIYEVQRLIDVRPFVTGLSDWLAERQSDVMKELMVLEQGGSSGIDIDEFEEFFYLTWHNGMRFFSDEDFEKTIEMQMQVAQYTQAWNEVDIMRDEVDVIMGQIESGRLPQKMQTDLERTVASMEKQVEELEEKAIEKLLEKRSHALEAVFDVLDLDGNGLLTNDEARSLLVLIADSKERATSSKVTNFDAPRKISNKVLPHQGHAPVG